MKTGIDDYTIRELKGELKRRKNLKKKQPLWVRKPLWWRLFDYFADYLGAWCLIFVSPVWFPIWFAVKIHKSNEKLRKEELERR